MTTETLNRTREEVAARKERGEAEYSRYEAYRQRQVDVEFSEIVENFEVHTEAEERLNEITDMSERLRMPMESTFYYERRDGGLYSEHGTDLREVVEDGYNAIVEMAEFRKDFAFEVVRRRLDVDELSEVMTLEEGEKLVTFLPIPDAVREGHTKIDGYSRERMKMLVRVTARGVEDCSDTVSITSFSLDGSHYEAMQAAAAAIGHDIPDDETSEAIVAKRRRFSAEHLDSPKEVVETIRGAYDAKLSELHGGNWFAGRPEMSEKNALEYVNGQTDLIDEHMKAVKIIKAKGLSGRQLMQELEACRYNLAAALDDRLNGKAVSSLSDAGDSARAEGRTYEGDCPTGDKSEMQQAQELGYKTRQESLKCVTCPFCGKTVDALRTTKGGIRCPNKKCDIEVVGGKVVDHKIKQGLEAAELQKEREESKKREDLRKQTVPAVYFREVIGIGSAYLVAYDGDTVVAEGDAAFALRRQISQEVYDLAV